MTYRLEWRFISYGEGAGLAPGLIVMVSCFESLVKSLSLFRMYTLFTCRWGVDKSISYLAVRSTTVHTASFILFHRDDI